MGFGCSHLVDGPSTEMGVLSVKMYDALEGDRLEIKHHTPQAFNPDFKLDISRMHGNELQLESSNNPDSSQAQLGIDRSASFCLLNSMDDRFFYPTIDRVRNFLIDPSSSSQELISLTDNEITTMLEQLMSSQGKDIKAVVKRLLTEVRPTADHDARQTRREARARSLPSREELIEPYCERYPAKRFIYRELESSNPQLNVDINNEYLLSYLPEFVSDDEKVSKTPRELLSTVPIALMDFVSGERSITEYEADDEHKDVLEYSKLQFEKTRRKSEQFSKRVKSMRSLSDILNTISHSKPGVPHRSTDTLNISVFSVTESSLEGQEEIPCQCQTLESDFSNTNEEDLAVITTDIDKFEQKINEIKAMIRELREESVIILTTENSENACDSAKVTGALSYLEIEQKICQLEDENNELESKRREAVSRLQKQIVGNFLGKERKDLLPLLPIPMPEEISFESKVTPTQFDVAPAESNQFSGVATSSETEASEVQEPSTQKDKPYSSVQEKIMMK